MLQVSLFTLEQCSIVCSAYTLRRLTSAVNWGRMVSTSPITPKSLIEKIGAFSSLLMATIYLEPFMPTVC